MKAKKAFMSTSTHHPPTLPPLESVIFNELNIYDELTENRLFHVPFLFILIRNVDRFTKTQRLRVVVKQRIMRARVWLFK